MARVLVLGGSVAGLAAVRLAKRGHEATVIERDRLKGLRCGRTDEGVLQVLGADLADGTHVDADVMLDCLGHGSPVPAWLAEHDATYCTGYVQVTDPSEVEALLAAANPVS